VATGGVNPEQPIEDLLRELAPQVLGTLMRRHGQFDACEDAVQEALLAASQRWPTEGVPNRPRSWLLTVASRSLVDHWRSESARRRREETAAALEPAGRDLAADPQGAADRDDTVGLLFLCCHPALTPGSALKFHERANHSAPLCRTRMPRWISSSRLSASARTSGCGDLAIDPQSPNTVREGLFTNTSMRRWPQAAQWGERMRAMAPASLVAKMQSGYVDFWWKGDTHLLKSIVDQVPAGIDPDGTVTSCRWDVAMLRRDYSAAKKVLKASSANELSYTTTGTTPKTFFEGCIYLAQGDNVNAQKAFELARPAFENAAKESPASAERHATLGWLYAFMGRKDDAIREGRRAVELKPESKDAVDGTLMSAYLALIYARVGENDLAIPLIDRLLKTPGAVDSADYSITINDLKYRWEWDPIRSDPRFQALIGEKKL